MLTPTQIDTLLSEMRAYLDITWEDTQRDNQIKKWIVRGADRIEQIYGASLHFVDEDDVDIRPIDHTAQEMLETYVFYADQKALDDWESNYQRELMYLRNQGIIDNSEDEEDAS